MTAAAANSTSGSISSTSGAAPATSAEPTLIARQPIFDTRRAIVGYELFNRSRTPNQHTAASDVLLVFTALSHAGEEDFVTDKLLFVICTHESLAGGHLDLLDPKKTVLEIQPLGHNAATEARLRAPLLKNLRHRGFRLSFDHYVLESVYADWLALADYVRLDVMSLPPEQWPVLLEHAKRHSGAQLVATKVESSQQFETLVQLGVSLFQGFWFSRPTVFEVKILAPRPDSLVQLMALLRSQASNEALEEILKKDVGLAFNLLRLINTTKAAGVQAPELTSFRQAVQIMGLRKLFRWAALLLAATKHSVPLTALGQAAVVRGRLMELLATDLLPPEQVDMAFMAGLFSLLESMLGISAAQSLALVHPPVLVRTALVDKSGIVAELLRLAKACEDGDDQAFDAVAEKLGLSSQQINWAHLRALAWSEQSSAG